MILELLKYLTTPCDTEARKAGYLTEAIAIEARSKRLKTAWRPHLENSKRAIQESSAPLPRKGKACIIGSGLHLDLPLAYLSETFDEVHLIDIVHLRSALRSAKRFSNTVIHQHDVTGAVAGLRESIRQGALPLQEASLPECCADADLVVSLNLLSQLPLLPEAQLEKSGAFSAEEIAGWCSSLITAHLQLLRGLTGEVLLLTDIERTISDRAKGAAEREDPLYGVVPGPPLNTWSWETAPEGELGRHVHMRSTVGLFDAASLAVT